MAKSQKSFFAKSKSEGERDRNPLKFNLAVYIAF